ncbi:unnamed protein product [Candidula unifasciata]|uniref:Uncharacterized protein n=1 Tax=Candidula unifasciata TaxID=100452 RepID=A0A8S3YWH7_9EUPU|nr:unnamed protein product [Candidula unifasciata]
METRTRRLNRRSSPELWIPYVLIGVSCVTFLAVHFWCYHKRNRERYLRKRDETRVKSGLLERRRITTLMLAKYQSDLGEKFTCLCQKTTSLSAFGDSLTCREFFFFW